MLDELMLRIGGRFGRVEPRRRARAFILGLVAGLPRKNCWTIAEHAGDDNPGGMQHLLTRNEIAHLAAVIIQPTRNASHLLHWSTWRRRHQHTARTCHYQRQAADDP